VVFAQGVMCGGDLIERELADVHVERPLTDERQETLEEIRVKLAVEA
jgi:hypothetical protein